MLVVETETDRDFPKVVETETLTRLSLYSALSLLSERKGRVEQFALGANNPAAHIRMRKNTDFYYINMFRPFYLSLVIA